MIYEYDIPTTFPGGLNLETLNADLVGGSIGSLYGGSWTSGATLSVEFTQALTAPQAATLQAAIDAQNNPTSLLLAARELRFGEIDSKTDEIFATGFEYPGSGVRLSLSSEAQSRLIGLMLVRDSATYPIRWNALDDASFVDLLSASDVITLFGAGATALRSYVDGGTAIKNEIREALTVAAVMAVVDPR